MCSQELHRSEICPGRASSRRGVDTAPVPPGPGSGPQTWEQLWGRSPSPPTRPACRGRPVAAAGEPGGMMQQAAVFTCFII